MAAFHESRGREALKYYNEALREAEHSGGPPEMIGRILRGIGACHLMMSDYAAALEQFLKARPYSIKGGNREDLAALDADIADVYLYQGDLESAERIYRRALAWIESRATSRYRAVILANLAVIELRRHRYERAIGFLQPALKDVNEADRNVKASIYDFIGQAWLGLRYYTKAKESFQLGLDTRRALGGTTNLARPLMSLGRAELESGDAAAALAHLRLSIASAEQRDRQLDLWEALYWRGLSYQALGESVAAVADLRGAVEILESSRPRLVPGDAIGVLFEVEHHKLYSALADILCELDRSSDAFEAVELGRAQSLRTLLDERAGPPGRRTETGDPVASSDSSALAPVGWRATAGLIESQKEILGPNSLLLNYYVGSKTAYLWAVTDSEARFYHLPPPAKWKDDVRRFLEAIQTPGADTEIIGKRIYRSLLTLVEPALLERRHWIIAADGDLVVLPFCALPDPAAESPGTGARGKPHYLVEKHSVSYVPSVSVLAALERRGTTDYEYDFLGVADPVVNRADLRWNGAPPPAAPGSRALPRLVASEAEIRACSREFSGERLRLLTGFQVSKAQLQATGLDSYRYWHFASHVVADTGRPNSSFIALSIPRAPSQAGARPEKLATPEILGLRMRAEMVLVNGCDSGAGKNLPGAGVVGLARAFLAAGARSVCATRWKMPDEKGGLAAELYRRLAQAPGNHPMDRAEALRQAQVEMIRRKDWCSQPRYWAAYFLMGSSN